MAEEDEKAEDTVWIRTQRVGVLRRAGEEIEKEKERDNLSGSPRPDIRPTRNGKVCHHPSAGKFRSLLPSRSAQETESGHLAGSSRCKEREEREASRTWMGEMEEQQRVTKL